MTTTPNGRTVLFAMGIAAFFLAIVNAGPLDPPPGPLASTGVTLQDHHAALLAVIGGSGVTKVVRVVVAVNPFGGVLEVTAPLPETTNPSKSTIQLTLLRNFVSVPMTDPSADDALLIDSQTNSISIRVPDTSALTHSGARMANETIEHR